MSFGHHSAELIAHMKLPGAKTMRPDQMGSGDDHGSAKGDGPDVQTVPQVP